MKSYFDSVEKVYNSLDECIIIGLTGRTGSGCSTAASILEIGNFNDLNIATPKKKDFKDTEERKDAIIYKFMSNKWEHFVTIEVSSIIMSVVFRKKYQDFIDHIQNLPKKNKDKNFSIRGIDELIPRLEGLKSYFDSDLAKHDTNNQQYTVEDYYRYFTRDIKDQKRVFAGLLNEYSCYETYRIDKERQVVKKSQLYTYLLQSFGNNLRSSGDPFSDEFSEQKFSSTAECVECVIDIIKEYNQKNSGGKPSKTRICIDAIRNPYEAYYLKDKFSSFFLVSVSTDDEERRARLTGFDENELRTMDEMEYPVEMDEGKIFFQQSIEECLQIADIHLYNPHSDNGTFELLTKSLVRYIALMIHPGIVTPTNIERCMQVAFTAKLNSGCLSRQVGAVITDSKYYIKAIGWNEVPQGQISCGLRTVYDYLSDRDSNTFSKYELENSEFRDALRNICDEYECCSCQGLDKYSISFCFKDIYNAIKHDKNQVHTRSLHAEENAFLQASKFGGQGILGGKLFVTASPCELCSKKSYQLGIKDIYYIDPYPGIASSHILKLGEKETNPKLHIFYGAVGSAYVSMYSQRFSPKDKLQFLSGVDMKQAAIKSKIEQDTYKLYEYSSVDLKLVFNNRYDIEFFDRATLIPLKDELKSFKKTLSWSGSNYERTVTDLENPAYTITDEALGDGLYNINFDMSKSPCTAGNEYVYQFHTYVKDEQEIMRPFLSYAVKAKTQQLKMCVVFKKSGFSKCPEKGKLVLYADKKNNIVYSEKEMRVKENDDDIILETEVIPTPNLLYTYSVEWEFE